MSPLTAAISAPIPPGMDFAAGLAPVLFLLGALLTSTLAIVHAALVARRLPEGHVEPRARRVSGVPPERRPLTA